MNRTILVLLAVIASAGCAGRGALDPEPGRYGVLLMAHGGDEAWNEAVLAAAATLAESYPVEVAFGMADAVTIQDAAARLEARGIDRIGVVRLFISGESWYERTEQILGVAPGAPARASIPPDPHAGHHGHSMEFWRIDSEAAFALSRAGLRDDPAMGRVLADRAAALSENPELEDVLVLAHGPGDDAENERWVAAIGPLAGDIRRDRPFRRVAAMTLREDWPEKRAPAEERIRDFVGRAAAEGGRAIVIPFRVHGFGPYAEVLEGLEYAADGRGLLPHPIVEGWLLDQARALEAGPFREGGS